MICVSAKRGGGVSLNEGCGIIYVPLPITKANFTVLDSRSSSKDLEISSSDSSNSQ
jgi:hypothetical protein